ncbi:hypothetical protein ElyMa_004894700 [Elysia marginata]|uniref:Uncharacterized protein n=1 Tax=Elysia marginata TaxID=1093978 RepID=A0AAV4IWR1_9GAST|nr:hypothetical protein ElyMa_004894700 [Elysia marginata]
MESEEKQRSLYTTLSKETISHQTKKRFRVKPLRTENAKIVKIDKNEQSRNFGYLGTMQTAQHECPVRKYWTEKGRKKDGREEEDEEEKEEEEKEKQGGIEEKKRRKKKKKINRRRKTRRRRRKRRRKR